MKDRFYLRYVYNNKIYDIFAVDFFNKTAQLVSLDRVETLFTKVDTDKLFQCTGLKDKNGKFVYEGDICRNVRNGDIVYVSWHGTLAGYVWSKKETPLRNSFGELFRIFDKYEVIGNIYENPELLEE